MEAQQQEPKANGRNRSFLRQLLGATTPRDAPRAKQRPELLERLERMTEERRRITKLLEAEVERGADAATRLQEKDTQLIELLAEARLEGRDPEQAAEALRVDIAVLRRTERESSAVAQKLRAELDSIRDDLKSLEHSYRHELACHLDQLYAEAMAKYNELAPELADAVLQVAALRRVMIRKRLGNTNGWSGQILLPGMRPKEGRAVPHLLDGANLGAITQPHEAAVEEKLRAAGFVFGLE